MEAENKENVKPAFVYVFSKLKFKVPHIHFMCIKTLTLVALRRIFLS